MKRAFLLLGFILSNLFAFSQTRFQLGIEATPIISFSYFPEPEQVLYKGIRKAPFILDYTGGPMLSYLIHPNFTIQAGYHILEIGNMVSTQHNYSAGEARNSRRRSYSLSEFKSFSISGRYSLPSNKSFQYIVKTGSHLTLLKKHIPRDFIVKYVNPDVQGDTVTFVRRRINQDEKLAFSISVGVGIKKNFKNGSAALIELTGNYGFVQLMNIQYELTINKEYYRFNTANNGSYMGLSLSYFLKPYF